MKPGMKPYTVEPRYKEGPWDWQNLFAITRLRYIQVLFHMSYYYWGKENRYVVEFVVWRFVRYRGSNVLGRSRALATGLSFSPLEKT